MHPEATVRDFVNQDFRAAAVFHQHGIDFCCGGGKTLSEVCRAKNLEQGMVMEEISRACAAGAETPRFVDWQADELARYIVLRHHGYCRTALPVLVAHTRKLANVHGPANPELVEIAEIVEGGAGEMEAHMLQEEQVLFPYVERLAATRRAGLEAFPAPFGDVGTPIRAMEADHDRAERAMARIRDLARDYAVPEHGCTTWRVTLQELQSFEHDLHTHVHLENNVLFPKARTLAAPPAG